MRPGSRRLSDHDARLWAEFAAGLRPLPGRTVKQPPQPAPLTDVAAPLAVARFHIAPRAAPRLGPLTIGAPPAGLDSSTWQKLLSGRLRADQRLDLHGNTATHAFHRFEHALAQATSDGLRCLEVITGRGVGEQGGVLRRELPHWINLAHLRPLILAASYPHAANTGSVRLLLRRPAHAMPAPRSRR
jgi:DNA-nicking Smr family endonuclease